MTLSICPPLHLTLEAKVSPELRTRSRSGILIGSQDPGRRSLSWLRDQQTFPSIRKPENPESKACSPQRTPDKLIAAAAFPPERRASQQQIATPATASCSNRTVLGSRFQIIPSSSSSSLVWNFTPSQSPPPFSPTLHSLVLISPNVLVQSLRCPDLPEPEDPTQQNS